MFPSLCSVEAKARARSRREGEGSREPSRKTREGASGTTASVHAQPPHLQHYGDQHLRPERLTRNQLWVSQTRRTQIYVGQRVWGQSSVLSSVSWIKCLCLSAWYLLTESICLALSGIPANTSCIGAAELQPWGRGHVETNSGVQGLSSVFKHRTDRCF